MVSNHAMGKRLVGDILQISVEAKSQKQLNPQIIDATVGVLYTETGEFYHFPTVNRILKSLNDEAFYTYAPSDGGKQYHKAVLKWVFQDQLDAVLSQMHLQVVATPGGTGAVSNSIYTSCDPQDTLLLPDLFWGPYKNMAITNDLKIEYYQFLKENKFNFDDFKKMANTIIEKQQKLVTIINDPCNNPSGYSFTNEELIAVINYMNSMPDVKFSLIYDIAYFDYAFNNQKREKMRILAQANDNIMINICFSASKSFSIYGLRTGAHIIMGKNQELVTTCYDASNYLARTRWSNATKAGISLLTQITQDEKNMQSIMKEIADARELLKMRSDVFIKEAKAVELPLNPYSGGFFMTIPVENSNQVFEDLKNLGIYTLPFKNCLRISLSAMPLKDIYGLAAKIKKTMTSSGKTN